MCMPIPLQIIGLFFSSVRNFDQFCLSTQLNWFNFLFIYWFSQSIGDHDRNCGLDMVPSSFAPNCVDPLGQCTRRHRDYINCPSSVGTNSIFKDQNSFWCTISVENFKLVTHTN